MVTEVGSGPESAPVVVPVVVEIPGDRSGAIASFFLGRTPVTNREYGFFLASGPGASSPPSLHPPPPPPPPPHPPPWSSDPAFSRPLQPVVGVTWDEAAAYASWLSDLTGGRWRLPTEAEWEHAMSAGLDRPRTPWGERLPEGEIPDGPLAAPWDTGRGTPNGFGVLDPGTVVHEWCLDWREAAVPSPTAPVRRASRGGSWRHEIRWSSPSAKSSLPPHFRYSDYGFRVLREMI